jgi:hypothetical protein
MFEAQAQPTHLPIIQKSRSDSRRASNSLCWLRHWRIQPRAGHSGRRRTGLAGRLGLSGRIACEGRCGLDEHRQLKDRSSSSSSSSLSSSSTSSSPSSSSHVHSRATFCARVYHAAAHKAPARPDGRIDGVMRHKIMVDLLGSFLFALPATQARSAHDGMRVRGEGANMYSHVLGGAVPAPRAGAPPAWRDAVR